jgi:Ca-activated chloride channel family protein
VPAGQPWPGAGIDPLKYQEPARPTGGGSGELLTVKLRYKPPAGSRSVLLERTLVDSGASLQDTSADFKFAAAVAAFGMRLRDSPYVAGMTFWDVRALAAEGRGPDLGGRRAELLQLVDAAATLGGRRSPRPHQVNE